MDKKIAKLILLLLIIPFLFAGFSIPSYGRSLDDIEKEIEQKKAELDGVNKELKSAQSNLNNSTSKKNSAQGRLNELKASIAFIEDQVEYNKVKILQLQQTSELKELEKEARDERQDRQLTSAYLTWKSEDFTAVIFGSEDIVKNATYYDLITTEEHASIESLAKELGQIKSDYEQAQKDQEELDRQIVAMEEEKKAKEAEIAQINQIIANDSKKLAAAQSQYNQTRKQIDQLNEEQKALQEYESWILGQSGNGGTKPITPGEYYFTSRGRDGVQGHGVGLSQNGALGAALAGWNYKQIISFYYQGTTAAKYTARTTVPVQGVGTLDVDTYAAGIGEVPSNGCENLGVKFGDLGYWGCWPKEAIKAQVVAARSYALYYTRGGYPICTSDSCQVYNGGEAKRWAATETSYESVIYAGEPAQAFYSANNNQGYGTANNETVWSSRDGSGSARAYLRSVNDNGFYYPAAYKGCGNGDCSKWSSRTNSYTLAEIQGMFSWAVTSPSTSISSADRTFITGILNDIGTLSSITFERDPSQRVVRLVVNGNKGSRKMGGWFFKSIWNIWVDSVKPSGEKDFIYSLTYFILKG